MEKHLKAYGMFLLFTLATAVIVRPMAQKANIPLLNQI